MSFRRTLQSFARYDVNPHLVKLWKVHKPTDGQVSYLQLNAIEEIVLDHRTCNVPTVRQVVRSLSPFEHNVFNSFAKAYPAEVRVGYFQKCKKVF